ncbi:XRE family transcriptional regulator [Chryseobacterium elymi]|uniref:XRE family transcriptional regulator n=1 Tax=Chryseobacterium elymi TaxID=395936 RepID=A0A3D9DNB6_9FLAO|nr:LexA family transcriptional regulator [Chryseobacterium elymi]REC79463.1 XRE family transcriptional regulator [Chryseobacterium elymi]
MLLLAENLRFLRNELNASQQSVADALLITRGRYSKYEDGASDPPIDILLKISRYYKVSVDLLISIDLRKYKLEELLKLSDNRILLPIKTDSKGENKIEVVPFKASMGYLVGYSDPDYIENLQTISLPFLNHGKYRAFPVEGDSMPPYKDGNFIIGQYIESLSDLKVGKTYIFITREGITYKRLEDQSSSKIQVSADNKFYQSYEIAKENLLEIWEFRCSIATDEFDRNSSELDNETIIRMFNEIKSDLSKLTS